MSFKSITILCLALLFTSFNWSTTDSKIKGITLVASSDPISLNTFNDLKRINANWVVINPFAFCTAENSCKINYDSQRQWWGERPEGIKDAIQKAHQSGLKVLLKPQIWIPGGWVGNVEFKDDNQKKEWRTNYEDFLKTMVCIADETKVEMLCIGTEYDLTVMNDLSFWMQMIKMVKLNYDGELTYASNWSHYDQLEIWSQLDYIGIDAYFPLVDAKTPNRNELMMAWKAYKEKIKALSKKYNKPIIFTEFGYLSVDGCAFEHWKLEPQRNLLKTNELAQANAYHALLETFLPEPWYKGCFLWKWYPNAKASLGEGYLSKDYTPQGKQAQEVIKEQFSKY